MSLVKKRERERNQIRYWKFGSILTSGDRRRIRPNSKDDTMGKLIMYVDSDYGGCNDDKRSKTGIIIKINGAAVIWRSLKHRHCEDHMNGSKPFTYMNQKLKIY